MNDLFAHVGEVLREHVDRSECVQSLVDPVHVRVELGATLKHLAAIEPACPVPIGVDKGLSRPERPKQMDGPDPRGPVAETCFAL